jgi:alpha-L-fucosidase
MNSAISPLKTLSQTAVLPVLIWLVLHPGTVAVAATDAPAANAGRALPASIAGGGNSRGYDMAPQTTLKVVEAANSMIPTKNPPGPFQPTWASLKASYQVPQWFIGAKFGLFMHWGLYSIPAHHNEWYEKHMYSDGPIGRWHVEHYGPQDKFGYKDFIPMFTVSNWDPNAWAELFKQSGAKFVIPTAEHHDNFALWDSAVTPFNAMNMGPHRDLIGELAAAVRKQGLKFGVSNHGMENFQFINPPAAMAEKMKAEHADLYDPKWADFYNVADRSETACERFLTNWFARNVELIDKYRPDILWFDNGVDQRFLDPLKLRIAAYYYNRANAWGKQVSLSTKKAAYAPSNNNTETIGSILDFEKIGPRSPAGIRTGEWLVDQPIGSTWGYTSDEHFSEPGAIINYLADTVSKNGTLLLNLSPKADGTFPQPITDTLLAVGRWLRVNGEAIYDTHNWVKFGEGSARGSTGLNIRFTVKDQFLYAIILGKWPGQQAVITSLGTAGSPAGEIKTVTLLGCPNHLAFTRDESGLTVKLPAEPPCKYAYVLKISGLKMPPPTWTQSGNPQLPPED